MTTMVRCPHCGQPSDSIKASRLGLVLFLFIGAHIRSQTEFACPTCTRQLVIRNTLINLPTANVMWPIIILPINLYAYIKSYEQGHSKKVLQNIQPSPAMLEALRKALQNPVPQPKPVPEPIFADYFNNMDQTQKHEIRS